MGKLRLRSSQLALHTRCRTDIPNRMTRGAPIDGAYKLERDHSAAYPKARPRNVGPCETYNCHGLTFAARRTMIASADVPMILEEDDYFEIQKKDVLAGDVAVYYSTGLRGAAREDAEHSGIVIGRCALGEIVIISKWGPGDERIHPIGESPYDSGDVRYYRIHDNPRAKPGKPVSRSQRLLRGQQPPLLIA